MNTVLDMIPALCLVVVTWTFPIMGLLWFKYKDTKGT